MKYLNKLSKKEKNNLRYNYECEFTNNIVIAKHK